MLLPGRDIPGIGADMPLAGKRLEAAAVDSHVPHNPATEERG